MYNLNEICFIQYNIITTSVFKYLQLLSIGETSIKSIPNPYMAVLLQPLYFQKNARKSFFIERERR